MTLGKIERFWKTIYEEFLVRAQFGSSRRPERGSGSGCSITTTSGLTKGFGGLCPADRYFEIQAELRKTMEQGIAEMFWRWR